MISSLERDGRPVFRDLRWGVYVTFAGDTDYVRRCFSEYGLDTDDSGHYSAMYKPYHLIGLELGISGRVGRPARRAHRRRRSPGTATSSPRPSATWRSARCSTAKAASRVYGRLMPARDSLQIGGLPLGLAHGVRLKGTVRAGQPVRWRDVAFDAQDATVRFRREMERAFSPS